MDDPSVAAPCPVPVNGLPAPMDRTSAGALDVGSTGSMESIVGPTGRLPPVAPFPRTDVCRLYFARRTSARDLQSMQSMDAPSGGRRTSDGLGTGQQSHARPGRARAGDSIGRATAVPHFADRNHKANGKMNRLRRWPGRRPGSRRTALWGKSQTCETRAWDGSFWRQ
jgi:hypothetical protein